MISIAGVAGRVLEFVVSKIAGHRLDLALDERKRAARVFLGLHDALLELEVLSQEFIAALDRVTAGKERLYSVWLRGFQARVDAATTAFLQRSEELIRTLRILDPDLAVAIGHVSLGKMRVFVSASKVFEEAPSAFRLLWNNDREVLLTSVQMRTTEDVDSLTLEKLYEVARMHAPERRKRDGVGLDLLDGLMRDRLIDFSFEPTNRRSIAEAARVVKAHLKAVSRARETLRRFIAEKFTIDDLLYATRQTSR